jgi:hypothetical protein
MRRPGIKGMVDIHPAFRAVELVGQHVRAGCRWVGVRHFEHRRYPAQRGRARLCLKVGLVFEARLAEVDLAVDHTGQDVQPGCIIGLTSARAVELANSDNLAAAYSDIGFVFAAGRHHGAVFQDQIIGLGHGPVMRFLKARVTMLR